MWQILLRVLLQNNNHSREKHGWYISLQEIQARAMVPKHFSQAYSRMLHFKKKRRIHSGHLTNVTNKQPGKDRQCTSPIDTVLKSKKLIHFAGAKDICGTMWLFLKSTHLAHPCTPHQVGTPLENSGTLWGVRYTRLTSTDLERSSSYALHN